MIAAHFCSLCDPIYTTTPQGMFSLHVLGAVAQLERALIAERTKTDLRAARRRGRVGSNPGLRARDPEAIRKVRASRDAAHLNGVLAELDSWLPIVRRMRPDQPWGDVVARPEPDAGEPLDGRTTASHGPASRFGGHHRGKHPRPRAAAIGRRPADPSGRGIKAAASDRTMQEFATQIEAIRERTPTRRNALASVVSEALVGLGRLD